MKLVKSKPLTPSLDGKVEIMDIKLIKSEIVNKLKSLNPKSIILFGSYAYGSPNEDSDLDILVIKNNYKNKYDEKRKIRKALNNIRISKDILVEKEDYFLSHSDENWINTALYDARHIGEILYEQK